MTRIFIGIIAAMVLIIGLQTLRLSNAKEDVELLEGNQARLEKTLTIAKESYAALESNKNIEIQLLTVRGNEREQRIKSLSEQNKQLAAIPANLDGCIDAPLPQSVVGLLQGAGDHSAGANASTPTGLTIEELPKASPSG